jgi:hypothetical protein
MLRNLRGAVGVALRSNVPPGCTGATCVLPGRAEAESRPTSLASKRFRRSARRGLTRAAMTLLVSAPFDVRVMRDQVEITGDSNVDAHVGEQPSFRESLSLIGIGQL